MYHPFIHSPVGGPSGASRVLAIVNSPQPSTPTRRCCGGCRLPTVSPPPHAVLPGRTVLHRKGCPRGPVFSVLTLASSSPQVVTSDRRTRVQASPENCWGPRGVPGLPRTSQRQGTPGGRPPRGRVPACTWSSCPLGGRCVVKTHIRQHRRRGLCAGCKLGLAVAPGRADSGVSLAALVMAFGLGLGRAGGGGEGVSARPTPGLTRPRAHFLNRHFLVSLALMGCQVVERLVLNFTARH